MLVIFFTGRVIISVKFALVSVVYDKDVLFLSVNKKKKLNYIAFNPRAAGGGHKVAPPYVL